MNRKAVMLLFLINLFTIGYLVLNAPMDALEYRDNSFSYLKSQINHMTQNDDNEIRKKAIFCTIDTIDSAQRANFQNSFRNNDTLFILTLFNTLAFIALFVRTKKKNKALTHV